MNYLVLSLVLWFALFAAIYLWKRSFAKAFFISSTILTVLTVALAAFVYQDIKDLQQNFLTQEKLFVLSGTENRVTGETPASEAEIITAFSVKDISQGEAEFFTPEQLKKIKDASSLLMLSSQNQGNYYKLLIFHLPQLFEQIPDTIEYQGIQFSKEQIKTLLLSDSPREEFLSLAGPELLGDIPEMSPQIRESVMSQLGSDEEFKGQIFGLVLATVIETQGPAFMLEAFHDGTIQVIPETISFKLIKEMPSSFLELATSKISKQMEP